MTRSFEIRLKFWAPKAAFWRHSVIINFLVNKSIFSQTKHAVICFTLRPTKPENVSRIYFLAVAAIFWKCLIFGHICSWYNCMLTATQRLRLNSETNMDALFYSEIIMQTTSQSSTYTFNITRIYMRQKKHANCMNNVFLYFFTAFTVTFYHILHHFKAHNQQKNLHPVCKLIFLISHDNISLQSWQNIFRTSVESTPLTRCLFETNCWILSCWLHYVTGLDIAATLSTVHVQVNLISVNSLQ